jgi:hypothetical protein
MRAEITQQNLYLILAGKASAVATFIAEDEHISPLDALTKFYSSETYRRLEREETKYWHWRPVALYQDYRHGVWYRNTWFSAQYCNGRGPFLTPSVYLTY